MSSSITPGVMSTEIPKPRGNDDVWGGGVVVVLVLVSAINEEIGTIVAEELRGKVVWGAGDEDEPALAWREPLLFWGKRIEDNSPNKGNCDVGVC